MVQEARVLPTGGVDCYPLSPLQQGMLFHSLDVASPGVDVEQVVCALREEIDPVAFEAAWREVIARHTALRTGFEFGAGEEPVQVVYAPEDVRLELHYAEFGNEIEAQRGVEEYLVADRRLGFPRLDRPPLRVALLRGGPARYWFVTTYHHLLLDGRAMAVMFREVLDLHDAHVVGNALNLSPARPYRTYIDWLQRQPLAESEPFWREYLRGLSTPTLLPLVRPSAAPAEDEPKFSELAFALSRPLTDKLRAAAAEHRVTLNTVAQAAWGLLLSRYTGEGDIVFGAVRACRHVPVENAASIVGLFINTVPVRVRMDEDASIGTWLRELREQWVAFRAHEHTPLMKVQRWSEVPAGQPLFDTLFNFQEPSWDAALRQLGGKWERREFEIRSQPNYPLAIDAYGGPTLIVKLLFDRGRFADDAMARLLGHYRVILEAIASGEYHCLRDLPLLTARERQQSLVEWNRTSADYPRNVCVHACVEARAEETPQALAVADAQQDLSYAELNRRANRVAHRLQRLGVGPDTAVAVCMERSVEMIVSWLAVLKAGGAFVPLDPRYPRERLAFQLRDCGAPVVLVPAGGRDMLPEIGETVTVLEIRPGGDGFQDESEANLAHVAGPRNLAYIIYTSGSTGQPKGVQIEHRPLMNLVHWHQRTFGITAADRATQVASPAFDASVWEIWPYLAAGASVHIPDENTRLTPSLLWPWIVARGVTISFVPTPIAESLLAEPWPAGAKLRWLLTGGDKLKRRPPVDFPCMVVNNYGPTENTVVATSGIVSPHGSTDSAPRIGRPIANTRLYVLDTRVRPVPVGVTGELYIGGESLARGYLNRPELTAEKFVRDPFLGAEAAQRIYRTGDLVRWTADGEIEFVGRIDGQVKIRGCRVELGEIEAVLHTHQRVSESVVLARPDERGQLQLVAYVVPPPEQRPQPEELIGFLRQSVPAYMVPAAAVVLERWPLTPNGKIDRKALPAPAGEHDQPVDFTAPASETEQTVARIWGEILGRSAIGRNDNFFDLGGHSLLAAQVISRLNHALQAALSVRTVFDQPTVAGLAREIDVRREHGAEPRPHLHRLKRRPARTEMQLQSSN